MAIFKKRRNLVIAVVSLFVLVQVLSVVILPHDNPPVTSEPAWSSPAVQTLAERACYDCHSNQTQWPWYSYAAPISWLVAYDVAEGRARLNFSEWDRYKQMANRIPRAVSRGSMPPALYLPLHPAANLTDAERARFNQPFKSP
jgi:hypothetical protein